MIFVAFKHAFLAELAYFRRQTAAVDFEVIGELLTVKGDVEAVAVGSFGLEGQI